jgi:rSAM/selenodomain-associated transferase 1
MREAAEVAVFAKAPIPGFAKTRLIPALGAQGAACLHAQLTEQAVAAAVCAAIGPVTLWCTPDTRHPFHGDLARRHGVRLAAQRGEDLGARMLAAFQEAASRRLILIGTDCPGLTPSDLHDAASGLDGADVVIAPTEDGGYALIAAACPPPALFRNMPWSTDRVAALTRERAVAAGLKLQELRLLWDVDEPAHYERLAASGFLLHPRNINKAS